MLSMESRRVAGVLLVVFPTVLYGGVSLVMFLSDPHSGYMDNPLRQNLFRAGHAHAGVLLVLSLIALRYVDEAHLLSAGAKETNGFIYLAYAGAIILAVGLLALGVGLLKDPSRA